MGFFSPRKTAVISPKSKAQAMLNYDDDPPIIITISALFSARMNISMLTKLNSA